MLSKMLSNWCSKFKQQFAARFMLFALLTAVLSLTACATGHIPPSEQVRLSCESYNSIMRTLAGPVSRGELSQSQARLYADARHTIGPICAGETSPPDSRSALTQIEHMMFRLQGLESQYTSEGSNDGN